MRPLPAVVFGLELAFALALLGCEAGAPLSARSEAWLSARHAALHTNSPPPGDLRRPPGPAAPAWSAPATIRVWRRAVDGSTASCSGRVDVVAFEDYVKHVLPHEWIASWDDEALKAGAVAARTYAAYWVAQGGKYTCADIDDTTASQVYKESTDPKCDADVDATAGQIAADASGNPIFAEYSAENGDPTADGVSEPYCSGQTVNGHGHGMCQWGTQRWATMGGKSYDWIVAHYYPSATLAGGTPPTPAYAARFSTMQAPPAELTAGDAAAVWLEYVNDGTAGWDASTRVGTTAPRDRASGFYTAGSWLGPSRPAAVDSGCAPGATGRFSFVVTAPEVEVDTMYTEHFGLVQESVTWFGPADDAVSFTVLVHPRAAGPNGDGGVSTDGASGGGGGGGGGGYGAQKTQGCAAAPGAPAPFGAVWILAVYLIVLVRRRA